MSKTAVVRISDALTVAKLCGELTGVLDVSTRRLRVAETLTTMLGAQVGAVSEGTGFRVNGNPHFKSAVAAGWVGSVERQEFARYMSTEDHCVDPNLRQLARRGDGVSTFRRCDLVSNRQWYGTQHVSEERYLARVDDVIYSVARLKNSRAGDVQCSPFIARGVIARGSPPATARS